MKLVKTISALVLVGVLLLVDRKKKLNQQKWLTQLL
jgi:hypothetical protein